MNPYLIGLIYGWAWAYHGPEGLGVMILVTLLWVLWRYA